MIDPELSRERVKLMTGAISRLRERFSVEILEGNTTEDVLLQKVKDLKPGLCILPWKFYLKASRLDGLLGLNRTGGPEMCGYFGEPTKFLKLKEAHNHKRLILLDLYHLAEAEGSRLLQALLDPHTRSGIAPLLSPDSRRYTDFWQTGDLLGSRAEDVTQLPEIKKDFPHWSERKLAIQNTVQALWSLVYDFGPGMTQARSNEKLASFHVGADATFVALRLVFRLPLATQKKLLPNFWPGKTIQSSPFEVLLRTPDLLRILSVPESEDIEIVTLFAASGNAPARIEEMKSIWIQPIAAHFISEPAKSTPGNPSANLHPLPRATSQNTQTASTDEVNELIERMKQELSQKYEKKLLELSNRVKTLQEESQELKLGGVGTALPLPKPDTTGLLTAFKERIENAEYELAQFQQELDSIPEGEAKPGQLDALRRRMYSLKQEEKEWMQVLSEILAVLKRSKARATGTDGGTSNT